MKFSSDINGFITGVRFYKGPRTTARTSATCGRRPARCSRPRPSRARRATGWQQVIFATPVAITANTTYVASYHTQRRRLRRRRRRTSRPPASIRRRCTRRPARSSRRQRRVRLRRDAVPDADLQRHQLLGRRRLRAESRRLDAAGDLDDQVDDRSTARASTITWTTNEDATSKIEYSTDPALLDEHARRCRPARSPSTSRRSSTQHSVALTGLAANTTYYYRVISVDRSGNYDDVARADLHGAGSDAARHGVADFAAGRPTPAPTSRETADGEVTLAPTAGSEFSGTGAEPGLDRGAVGCRRLRAASATASCSSTARASARASTDGSGACQEARQRLGVSGAHRSTSSRRSAATRSSTPASARPADRRAVGHLQHDAPAARSSPGRYRAPASSPTTRSRTARPTSGSPHRYRIDWQTDQRRLLHRRRARRDARLAGRRADAADRGERLQRLRRQHRRRLDAHVAVRRDRHVRVARVRRAARRSTGTASSGTATTPAGTGVAISVRVGDTRDAGRRLDGLAADRGAGRAQPDTRATSSTRRC